MPTIVSQTLYFLLYIFYIYIIFSIYFVPLYSQTWEYTAHSTRKGYISLLLSNSTATAGGGSTSTADREAEFVALAPQGTVKHRC